MSGGSASPRAHAAGCRAFAAGSGGVLAPRLRGGWLPGVIAAGGESVFRAGFRIERMMSFGGWGFLASGDSWVRGRWWLM